MRTTIDSIGRSSRASLGAPLLLVLAALLWGSNFVVGRLVGHEISPVALSFWRWLGALAFLLPLSGRELLRQRELLRARWRLIAALGLTGIAVYNICVYTALRTTTAVNAALFMALLPLAIVLAARLLDRESGQRTQLPGMALSLLGALTVVTRGDVSALLGLRLNPGDLWMLVAVPLWAVYAVLQRRRPAELSPIALVTAAIFAGVVMLAPAYLLELAAGMPARLSPSAALGAAYAALGPSAIGYVLWNQGASALGSARAGVYINLIPVFSALLGVSLVGEALETFHLTGAALVATGIALTQPGATSRLRRIFEARPRARARQLAAALPWLDEADLAEAARHIRTRHFKRGETILRQGEAADQFYVVVRGEVEVFLEERGTQKVLARLGPGQHFGELGLLWGTRRLATVRAATTVELIELDGAVVREVIAAPAKGRRLLLRGIRGRVAAELRRAEPLVARVGWAREGWASGEPADRIGS